MKYLCLLIVLCMCSVAQANLPDGTLVFSNSNGLVGRVAKRITGGDTYTHIGIVIDGKVYESDWPRSRTVLVSKYGHRRCTYDYYVPIVPFSKDQVDRMRCSARSMLNQPYRLRNYFRPNSRRVRGTWCSPYTGKVLNASGRYVLSEHQIREPQNIFNYLRNHYRFHHRVCR